MNEFAKVLRELVKKSDKSITEVAKISGVDVAYLRKLMAGQKRNPSIGTIIKIVVGLVADPKLYAEESEMVENAFGWLVAAHFSDAAAGDYINSHSRS